MKEKYLIGTVNLSTDFLLYEDCVGRINFPNGVGEGEIYVYGSEGTIPHFHIITSKGESCICIYQPLYFNHGYKTMKLNSKQRKILDKWLESDNVYNKVLSNWEYISELWINANGYKYIPNILSKPNYRYMENMRN